MHLVFWFQFLAVCSYWLGGSLGDLWFGAVEFLRPWVHITVCMLHIRGILGGGLRTKLIMLRLRNFLRVPRACGKGLVFGGGIQELSPDVYYTPET